MHIKGLRVLAVYFSLFPLSLSLSLRELHTVIYTGPNLEIQFDSAWNESRNSVRVAVRREHGSARFINPVSAKHDWKIRKARVSKRLLSREFSRRDATQYHSAYLVRIKRLDRTSSKENFLQQIRLKISLLFRMKKKKVPVSRRIWFYVSRILGFKKLLLSEKSPPPLPTPRIDRIKESTWGCEFW